MKAAMPPEITVIVPFYNVEPYFPQCLESIAAQTFTDFEVICVDDCGTDGSAGIAAEHCAADRRFSVIRHDRNRGQGTARNTALRSARGRFIVFVDSDDWLAANTLELARRAMDEHRVNSVWFGLTSVNDRTGESFLAGMPEGLADAAGEAMQTAPCAACNKLHRRDFLIGNRLEFDEGILYEDLGFFFRCCILSGDVFIINEPLYFYRRWAGSTMGKSLAGQGVCADMVESCRRCHAFLRDRGLLRGHGDALLSLYALHFEQFLFSRFYKKEMIGRVRELLDEIGFAENFDGEQHPLLAAVHSCPGGSAGNMLLYKVLGGLNKLNPARKLREKWRTGIRVRYLAR